MVTRFREIIRLRHYAKSTEKTYLHWAGRFPRLPLILPSVWGCSLKETAVFLNCSVPALAMRQRRLRLKLKRQGDPS